MTPEESDEELAQQWYDRKSEMMEDWLGNEHDMVMHAIIPFAIGGGLDLYYYPNGIDVPGTGIATKELSDNPHDCPSNDVYRAYELVMFTRHPLDLDQAKDERTRFGKTHTRMNAILNHIAQYSFQAKLNPNETCEFPRGMETVGGKCLIFDAYTSYPEHKRAKFGLLLVIEVFRSEMDFARANGGRKLLKRLKASGYYPYSDGDRERVA